jgi:hypothetical protein
MSNTEQENFAQLLKDSFARWHDIFENGCNDPYWSDGVNLKLIRNHILHYKRKIGETMPRESYPEEYYLPPPPEVENSYMAKPDEIRYRARQSLQVYKEDENYKFLLLRYHFLSKDDKKTTQIALFLQDCTSLEFAIALDDLVTMRRHGNPERCLSSFKSCADSVRKIEPQRLKPYQLGLLGAGLGR